jgi:hypothetical protein
MSRSQIGSTRLQPVAWLSSDPGRYAVAGANVFPCAIGRSFYEQVLPSDSAHLGWCSYAAVWLSRIPSLIPGHLFPPCSTGAAQIAFERQAAEEWETLLSLRACEMRAGARLVAVLPGLPERGDCQVLQRLWIMRTLSSPKWRRRIRSALRNGSEWFWDRTRDGRVNFWHHSRSRANFNASLCKTARYQCFQTLRGRITSSR